MQKIKQSCGLHDGHFHADEVTACALLILFKLIKKDQIYRSREEKVLNKCEYVCDVGGIYNPAKKRFDHHQNDYLGDLSSAGMVLLYLKDEEIISEDLFSFFNKSFIKGVDAHDIGQVKLQIGFCSFSQIIESYVPLGEDVDKLVLNEAFHEALYFIIEYLKRLLKRFSYLQDVKKIVKKHMQTKDKYLVFDKAVSWVESFFELKGEAHPALFIIMPAGNHWKLRCIPPSYEDRMNVRVPLPESWAGLRGEDLQKTTGIEGAIFCHKGRFISFWETKEDALEALKIVLKEEGIR